jgi:Zn-dependent peptidase ImmA (M78 family)
VRFQFCRGLYEFLAGGDGPWLVTRGLSDRQKRNRAFAAEFLAPAAGIREKVSSSVISAEEVDDLAQHYGVASEAIVHQLANHDIASVSW